MIDEQELILARRFLRSCRRQWGTVKVVDSTGVELTGGALLTRALVLRRLLRRGVLADDERNVGVLLPPSVGCVVVNATLAIDCRVAVNLNYTVSSDVMNQCIRRARIRRVLTSRKVMERFDLKLDAEIVYLEDFRDKVSLLDKVIAATMARLMPMGMLERLLGVTDIAMDELLTIVFTSGSTGIPKGVMLTQQNVAADMNAFRATVRIDGDDTLMGILPMFHAFGYTVTLWTVLTFDARGAYHVSPLEPRQVGKLCKKYGGTILIVTPTFLRSYLRRCRVDEFQTIDLIIAGAEKLPRDLVDAFEEKFGIRPVEGYGTTELSPVVGTNVPPHREAHDPPQGNREGTVGRPLIGISAKVVSVDTGEEMPTGQQGVLLIGGDIVMKGYLDQPEATAEVLRDGWYVTGDMATIDEDGYITITGRISRFSKIGGEMVPHIRIEEAIMQIAGEEESLVTEDDQDGDDADGFSAIAVAVASVPDERKGERIVVLYTSLSSTPIAICRKLGELGLPPIWIPSPESFYQVDAIPILGTGKLDLKALGNLAAKHARGDQDR